jgi:3-dehydroquinate synthase
MRGISFGYVPTSLLSMVDASIGGKNGIDVGSFKNLIGTIRQPDFILHDYRFLSTLPEREWSNGFAEIIKHAAIGDPVLFKELHRYTLARYRSDTKVLQALIIRNVRYKFRVVRNDPFEKGDRKHLNFGHTLGHALEIQYDLSHGEAISLGMVFAAKLSEKKFAFRQSNLLCEVLTKYGLPLSARFSVDKIMRSLRLDKKRRGDKLDYILLKCIGQSVRHPLRITEIEQHLRKLT